MLILCLVDLSIGVNGVLNSITIMVLLLISPFILLPYILGCFYVRCIYIYDSYICFLDRSLIIMSCPYLSLFTAFILKSILSDRSIATPAFFWALFAWNIFPQPFSFSLYVSLVSRWVFCRWHIYCSCFCSQTLSFDWSTQPIYT